MWEVIFGLLFLGIALFNYLSRDYWIKYYLESLEKWFPNKDGRTERFHRTYYNIFNLVVGVIAIGLISLGLVDLAR